MDATNLDDANIAEPKGNFDKDTGLWDYGDLTKHQPLEMFDPQLVMVSQKRNVALRYM